MKKSKLAKKLQKLSPKTIFKFMSIDHKRGWWAIKVKTGGIVLECRFVGYNYEQAKNYVLSVGVIR